MPNMSQSLHCTTSFPQLNEKFDGFLIKGDQVPEWRE